MGRVYLARDILLDREVALKVSLVSFATLPTSVPNLVVEGQTAALLNHPSIASVYDSGTDTGIHFSIFEYVEGNNLRVVMQLRPAQWRVQDVASILLPLADALDHSHARGVIHSDLKPENICIGLNGSPKILDFGIANRLQSLKRLDSFMGTPAYASPEQTVCGQLDGRSDQYALALIAYELLCGRRPFLETNAPRMLLAHLRDTPPSPTEFRNDLPQDTVLAVMRALEKAPQKRFATCREFAAALLSKMVDTKSGGVFEKQTDVHITETQTESLVAKILAGALEAEGYRCWYYQRDALPGIPLNRQVRDSLQRTRGVLLLISRHSMDSQAFADEVMEAHQLGRPHLPILVDMSLEEFESRPPVWRAALGSATVIEFHRNYLESLLQRLCRSLQWLEVFPHETPRKVAEVKKGSASQIWATDSNQIDNKDLPRIVFRNQVINDYLNRPNKYFLSATKGLGKTLLIKYKRHLITQQADNQRTICMIPSGQPYLDFMSEMKLLSQQYEAQLSDLSFCKRLWGTALRISVLSNHHGLVAEDQQFELDAFPQRIRRWLRGAHVEPTVAFKELTNLPLSEVNRLIDRTENFLDEQIRNVHAATYVFIDKVDQAVRHLSRRAWIQIQAGLIEAAWDMMSANSHIKVYATIRQEAFANFQSDIKTNLLGATAMLRYSENDLRMLLNQLTGCYEGVDSFQTFVGVNVIKHPCRAFPEDSFEFLKRYTFGRPRDFVAIASELSSAQHSLDERKYCDVIRNTSAGGLVPSLFDENRVFLDCLFDPENQSRFFGLLRTNILTRKQAIDISKQFNGLSPCDSFEFDEESPEIFHPFQDLFLTGLLGVIKRNDQDQYHQRFRQPDDLLNAASASDLPTSSHYLVHPALSEYIQKCKFASNYRIIQHILIGENASWHSFDPIVLQIELAMEQVADIKLRGQLHQRLAEGKALKLSVHSHSLRADLESIREWRELMERLDSDGYDDVVLWFDELLEA